MRADITRSTYKPAKRFASVRMQQGRVQLDADWNEQLDIQAHLDRTTAQDVIGACGVPEIGGGFQLAITANRQDFTLTAGRIYVDGILCENLAEEVAVVEVNNQGVTLATLLLDGVPVAPGQWLEIVVPVQGEPPKVTQVQIASITNGQITFVQPVTGLPAAIQEATARRVTTYLTQPDLPTPRHSDGGKPPKLILDAGSYLAYLDVWDRSLTAVEDPSMKEPALAGPDTAFRTKTVWQLELMQIPQGNAVAGCAADFPDWEAKTNPVRGTLAARAKAPDPASGDPICILPAGGRYNGLENQLYRVEIHKPGKMGTATFKWSRENGSVEAAWTGQNGTEMKVSSTGRDGVLGFTGAGSIELVDDSVELSGAPDPAGLITGYSVADETTLTLPAAIAGQGPSDRINPRIRRWENTAEILTGAAWIPLERGVEVMFGDGTAEYQTGDYWLIPARTPNGAGQGDVEWPVDPSVIPADDPTAAGTPLQRRPDGPRHHFCKLDVVNKGVDRINVNDCRVTFPSLATLDAEDVAFTASAQWVGAGDTVESALEFLFQDSDDRGHNQHLHGTGIVDGLQVQCDPDSTKVHVNAGYAIGPDGSVVEFADVPAYDLIGGAKAYDNISDNGKIITGQPNPGDGEASLYLGLNADNAWDLFVEPYDPSNDTPASALNGTMLMDIYNDCIKKLQDWLKGELNDTGNSGPASKADQLRSALTNLGAQFVSPNTGQNIFLSLREHNLLKAFYEGLKLQLQSHTFCAMFTGIYPDYKGTSLNGIGMDTIFGKGSHTRLRLRPGTKEAYTVGPGLNPLKPSTTLNRYDLSTGALVNVYDALAGVDLKKDSSTSSGADSAQDVAFVGSNIWVIIPTRDGNNTILRWGVIAGSSINWTAGGWTSLCGVKLVTLGITSIDPSNLYGIGQGSGLYKIDISNLTKITAQLYSPRFTAVGDLCISDGIAYATEGNASTGVYTQVRGLDIAKKSDLFTPIKGVNGRDGIAVAPNAGTLYVAVEQTDANNNVTKSVIPYNMTTGAPLGKPPIAVFGGAFQMANFGPTGQLLLAVQGDYSVRLLDVTANTVATQYLLPTQVDPVAIASDGANTYVLNYSSNTITAITQSTALLKPSYDTAALVKDLADYRAKALEAFAELVGGLAQYIKDCVCDHLLVNPPKPMENKLYLAAVRIRGNKVDKICNLTKRRYVKSFPTVGYWLSLWPVIPMLKWAIAQFCCTVIPDATAKIKGETGGSGTTVGQSGSNPIEKLQEWLDRVQGTNPFAILGTIATLFTGKHSMGTMMADSFLPARGAAPASAPLVATNYQPTGRVGGGAAIVGQPTSGVVGTLNGSGVAVEVLPYQPSPGTFFKSVGGFFTDPVPGSTVTLYEESGIVKAYELQPQGPSADVQRQVSSLSQSLQARDAQIGQLQNQLTAMQVQQAQLVATQRQHLEMVNGLRAILESRGGGGFPPGGGPVGGAPVAGGPVAGGPVAGGPIVPHLMAMAAPRSAAVAGDPVEALLLATLMRVDRVAYHQSGFGPIGAAQRERTNFCVPKAAGQLGFVIDTVRDLGLSPEYQMQIALQGRVAGSTPGGDPVVEWSIDQVVGREFHVLGVPVQVDAVVGTLRASLQAVNPARPGPDCQGQQRSFTVALAPDPEGGGRLSAHARALAMELTIDLSNIAVAGWAGS